MARSELYRYNPRQTPPEELEATFVGRDSLLCSLLDDLRARADSPVNQHFLVTGPRGVGKTNFLLLIADRVSKDPVLSAAYQPLQTAEEEYSVTSLRDFFCKIIGLLLEEGLDSDLDSTIESIACISDDEQAAECAIRAVADFCRSANRKILLLVDNIDLILGDQLADNAELGRLRDLLMNEAFLVLVAAAPTYFKEVSGYDRPFYQFFKPIELEDLSFEQTQELLQRRAELDDNRDILERFDELKPRFRVVHHLTGGNPRLSLMLYQLCAYTELPEIRAAIQMLLDDMTPYYKHRLEALSAQQRKVMDTFARLARPATPTELSRETRLPVNQVTSILNRLRELGFVTPAPQKRRRTTHYLVSERVFRIWHQMRFSAVGRRRLEFLIDFLRIWYTVPEWQQETDRLTDRLTGEYRRLAEGGRSDRAGHIIEHLGYLAEAAPEPKQGHDLADDVVRTCIESKDFARAEQILDERVCRHTKERNQDRLAHTWFLTAYLCYSQGRRAEEIEAFEKVVRFKPDFHEALYNWGIALYCLAQTKSGTEQEQLLREACAKNEAAVKLKPNLHEALYNWGSALYSLARTKSGTEQEQLLREACVKYAAAVKLKPNLHEALYNWGLALDDLARIKSGTEQEQLFVEVCAKYAAAVKIKPDYHKAHFNWGIALSSLAQTKSGSEQEQLFREACARNAAAIKIKPDDREALYNWGIALYELAQTKSNLEQEQLLREACVRNEAAIKIKPDFHEALSNWGLALSSLAQTKSGSEQEQLLREACAKCEAAVKLEPDFHGATNNWGIALSALAQIKTGAERAQLEGQAAANVTRAIEISEQAGSGEDVAFYAAHYVRLMLLQCGDAIEAQNLGQARDYFVQALDSTQKADRQLRVNEFIGFFTRVARRRTAIFCMELFQEMLNREMEELAEILVPFAHAVDYWLREKDPEHVLDRLNPEIREIVERIISRGEESS